MVRNELAPLVDEPHEREAVEYKSWLDLGEPRHKADLARHIAALTNYGGGHIVFGFEPKRLAPCAFDAALVAKINSDIVAGIVGAYLTPAFHCDVFQVRSAAGNVHPVIRVPPHGPVPVCAKKNGPDTNGQPQGITAGVYYLRKPGPRSEVILNADEWGPLIRRCTLHDRAAILAALSSALQAEPEAAADDVLQRWHAAGEEEFIRQAKAAGLASLAQSHVQLSYRIVCSEPERAVASGFERLISEVNNEVHDTVQTGWSMFYPFAGEVRWTADESVGDDDFLQLSLIGKETVGGSADFWRISPTGLVTLVRDYWEDGSFFQERYNRAAGTSIDPYLALQSLAELLRHARGFAERFATAQTIQVLCRWSGLAGRSPFIAQRYGYRLGHTTDRDDRVLKGTYPVALLATDWPQAVADLAAPLARSLGIEDYASAPKVAGLADAFRRLG